MRTSLSTAVIAVLLAASCTSATRVPTPTPSATSMPPASAGIAPTPTRSAEPAAGTVYFARDRLPPVGVVVPGAGAGDTAPARILARLNALFAAAPPQGLFNTTLPSKARPVGASIGLDVATIDFAVPDSGWGTAGSAGTRAFLRQIVYTAGEEPGVRRILITENGHEAIIGGEGLVIDHPVSREDVAGYATTASLVPMEMNAAPAAQLKLETRASVDQVAPGLVRFVVDTGLYGADAKGGIGFILTPRVNDDLLRPELGKWDFIVDVPSATAKLGTTTVGTTPLRTIKASAEGSCDRDQLGCVRYELGLDDLRPWRAAVLYEPLRLVVDIGGDPDAVSPNIAVYAPRFGQSVTPGFLASGLVRAFEAQYEYRIVGYDGAVLVDAFDLAALGTSELWGAFSVAIPHVPPGGGMLEILLRSPKDGSISEQVSIPIASH